MMTIKKIFMILIMALLLLSGCRAQVPPQLLSAPDEIARTVELGMELEEVISLINPQYGEGKGYFLNCEFIVTNPKVIFSPINEGLSKHFILFFMPEVRREGSFFMPKVIIEQQPTAVFFRYDDSEDKSLVIAVDRLDYERVEQLLETYGTPIIWGD